jgi:hypothetical protein
MQLTHPGKTTIVYALYPKDLSPKAKGRAIQKPNSSQNQTKNST